MAETFRRQFEPRHEHGQRLWNPFKSKNPHVKLGQSDDDHNSSAGLNRISQKFRNHLQLQFPQQDQADQKGIEYAQTGGLGSQSPREFRFSVLNNNI